MTGPGLLMPRHVAAARQQQKRDEAAAASIASRSRSHELQSDEFVNRAAVRDQLAQLHDYLADRRQEYPDYQLPQPSGWKLTVLMLTFPETSAGGLVIVDEARETRSVTSPQGIVLALGPGCYTDPDRFAGPDGKIVPWHAVGDRITWIKYDATLYRLANGQIIGFLTDTQPVALIDKGWEVPL